MKNTLYGAGVAIGCIALTWPFLVEPGQFLYVRYFDANTLFSPQWMFQHLFSVWSYDQHLGYAHARDLAYISVQELVSVAMAPFGADFRNRSSLICTALLLFVAFLVYARTVHPDVRRSTALIASFFYASNPWVVAFIHDGYSGLLVDYGLVPVGLLLIHWAKKCDRPVLVSLVPFLFFLTGMYNLTSVIVALLGIVLLEYQYLADVFRRSRTLRFATALALSLNVLWAAPLAYDLSVHPKQSIQAESQGDIGVLTQYGGLTNTILLRSFPSIWLRSHNARECTACTFYESPQFDLGMLFLAGTAFWALWRARRRDLLIALAVSIIVATGFKYEDELLGLPYQMLMNLPTFDAFRSSVKFSAVTALLYSLGLLYASRSQRSWRFVALSGLAAIICAWPYVTGGIIERNSEKHFPNFVVRFPSAYAELGREQNLFPTQNATLLLPDMPLAGYIWGAYGNDFLAPLIARPTLATSYLPEPNERLDGLLHQLVHARTAIEATAYMRALGVGRVLYHKDAAFGQSIDATIFGKTARTLGNVQILDPQSPPTPRFEETSGTVPVIGATGIALFGGAHNVAAVGFNADSDLPRFCNGSTALVLANFGPAERFAQSSSLPLNCSIRSVKIAVRSSGKNLPRVRLRQRQYLPIHWQSARISDGTWELRAESNLAAEAVSVEVHLRSKRDRIDYISWQPSNAALPAPLRAVKADENGALAFRIHPSAQARTIVFNENFDPVWLGFSEGRRGRIWAPHFTINYFANAWSLPAGSSLLVVNALTAVWLVSAWLTVALAAVYGIFMFLAIRKPSRP